MIGGLLDIILLVDTSTTDRGVIEAIKENIKEVLSELEDLVNRISLISFSNIPELIDDRRHYEGFDINSILKETGGMCNVHLALRSGVRMTDDSVGTATCILLFLCSDPTDTDRIIDEDMRDLLADAEKYLVKKSLSLLEPSGFDGSRMYLLGSEKDLHRLIRDIRNVGVEGNPSEGEQTDIEEDYPSTDRSSESSKSHYEKKVDSTSEAYLERKNVAQVATIYFEEEELPSPDIYS